jgi:ubiquitin related modifier 1
MLFANERTLKLAIPQVDSAGSPVDVSFLVQYLCEKEMRDSRKELFVLDDTV